MPKDPCAHAHIDPGLSVCICGPIPAPLSRCNSLFGFHVSVPGLVKLILVPSEVRGHERKGHLSSQGRLSPEDMRRSKGCFRMVGSGNLGLFLDIFIPFPTCLTSFSAIAVTFG